MIIRILLRFKLWKRRGTKSKKTIRMQTFFVMSFIALFFIVLFTLSLLTDSAQQEDAALPDLHTKENTVSLSFERTAQFGRSLFYIEVIFKTTCYTLLY